MTAVAAHHLPFDRPNALDLAPLYAVLRHEAPITAVTTPTGDPAWLVTRFDEVRDLLGDARLGRSHPQPATAARLSSGAVLSGPAGDHAKEQADHARMRTVLTPAFSAKRMMRLTDEVQDLVDREVDAVLARHDADPTTPVDLHPAIAVPLPVAVICTLLGVPISDAEHFRGMADRMTRFGADAHVARDEFARYMIGLAEQKRVTPTEDVISDLVRAQAADPDFDYEMMIRLSVGLLLAGHETTVSRIGLGVLLLMTHREHWDALVADPGRIGATVEEIMRVGAPGELGAPRYARTDIQVGDTTIRRGDLVVLSINAANRDPREFTDPERFDPGRAAASHLGFGHGPHYCIGASLARVELRIVFATLARRLPEMRLAKALSDIGRRTGHMTGGVTELPVTW